MNTRPTEPPAVPADDPIAAHIARIVADWPPLTRAQRDRVSALLWPPTHENGAKAG
ncbi:MAG: hypothetical protein L0I76_24955 [Pseudonocardia sp.]|nr:hypothetical protein [Pseudonocardia sp.]